MTEPREEKAICGAPHPVFRSVTCALFEGENSDTSPEFEKDDNGNPVFDEEFQPIVLVPPQRVHVHKGMDGTGTTHRWE